MRSMNEHREYSQEVAAYLEEVATSLRNGDMLCTSLDGSIDIVGVTSLDIVLKSPEYVLRGLMRQREVLVDAEYDAL